MKRLKYIFIFIVSVLAIPTCWAFWGFIIGLTGKVMRGVFYTFDSNTVWFVIVLGWLILLTVRGKRNDYK